MRLGELRRALAKKIPDVLMSALGFLLALTINGWISAHNDNTTYGSLLTALKAEASGNQRILENKLVTYTSLGMPVGDLSLSILTQTLANPLFVRHSSDKSLALLNRYLRDAMLAGSYRKAIDTRIASNPAHLEDLGVAWRSAEYDLKNDLGGVAIIK